jgi:hypothetical protein
MHRTKIEERTPWSDLVDNMISHVKSRNNANVDAAINNFTQMAKEADAFHGYKEATKLYYNYKKTSDQQIRDYLKEIKILVVGNKGKGTVHGFYELADKSLKKILAKPRENSLTFDATEKGNYVGELPWKELGTITFLCKSTSRFFLKPDIGEVFDQIPWEWFHITPKMKGIEVLSGYETIPDTEGEHHFMRAKIYTLSN